MYDFQPAVTLQKQQLFIDPLFHPSTAHTHASGVPLMSPRHRVTGINGLTRSSKRVLNHKHTQHNIARAMHYVWARVLLVKPSEMAQEMTQCTADQGLKRPWRAADEQHVIGAQHGKLEAG